MVCTSSGSAGHLWGCIIGKERIIVGMWLDSLKTKISDAYMCVSFLYQLLSNLLLNCLIVNRTKIILSAATLKINKSFFPPSKKSKHVSEHLFCLGWTVLLMLCSQRLRVQIESEEQVSKWEIINNLCNKIIWTADSATLCDCLNRIITLKKTRIILLKIMLEASLYLLKKVFSKLDCKILRNTLVSWRTAYSI